MRGRTTRAVLANPVLVGAVTLLVTIVAVFLAYTANQGLPFVPTFELRAKVPNGAKLIAGNVVREGGHRIGAVDSIETTPLKDGTIGAEIVMKLDESAAPIPADSTIRIRPRSALGLKYVELTRGTAKDTLPTGSTIVASKDVIAPELQTFFNIFDEQTRQNIQANLGEFGNALAVRGRDINVALQAFPGFLASVPPVMRELAQPDTRLARFFSELGDAARITAPLAETMADGFAAGASTFGALARDPQALEETIAESPDTLRVGTSALRGSRPFLRSLAGVSDELRGAAAELRRSAPPIRTALASGISPLKQTPPLNARLDDTFESLTKLAKAPGTDIGVRGLTETASILNPLARYLGPYQTVCNYWNYSFTFLADHITDQDQTGSAQRILVKMPSQETMGLGSFGQADPVPTLHAQAYGAAITPSGAADCETGQRGFPHHLLKGTDPSKPIALEPYTPGAQGPTFKGRPRVPAGETFSSVAEGAPPLRDGEPVGP